MVDRIQNGTAAILGGAVRQLDLPSEEIKTALQLKIFAYEKIDGNTFYLIRTWLVDELGEISEPIRKRYSQFFELQEKLTLQGYQ